MCGRFTITVTKEELEEYMQDKYGIDEIHFDVAIPNFNVAPGSNIISIINDGKKYRIGLLKWGFEPFFQTKKCINAKAETIFEKAIFSASAVKKRCIILADSFYEWQRIDKQPLRILTDGALFPMAGIWNSFKNAQGETINTAAIITTNSNSLLASIHERMPVILNDDTAKKWLDSSESTDELKCLLQPFNGSMQYYKVSKNVNSPKINDVSLIKKLI